MSSIFFDIKLHYSVLYPVIYYRIMYFLHVHPIRSIGRASDFQSRSHWFSPRTRGYFSVTIDLEH